MEAIFSTLRPEVTPQHLLKKKTRMGYEIAKQYLYRDSDRREIFEVLLPLKWGTKQSPVYRG